MKQLWSGTIWRVRIFDPDTQSNEYYFLEDAGKQELENEMQSSAFITLWGNMIKKTMVNWIHKITADDAFMHAIAELWNEKKRFFSLIRAESMNETIIKKSLYDFLLHLHFDRIIEDEIYIFKLKEWVTLGHRTKDFIKKMHHEK